MCASTPSLMVYTLKLSHQVLTTRHKLTRYLVSYGRLADHGCLLDPFQERHAVLSNANARCCRLCCCQKDNPRIEEIVMSAFDNIRSGEPVMGASHICSWPIQHPSV